VEGRPRADVSNGQEEHTVLEQHIEDHIKYWARCGRAP
jgi:hypothetical protein